jgi:hypothetical protein
MAGRGVVKVAGCLLSKHEALSSKTQYHQKDKMK